MKELSIGARDAASCKHILSSTEGKHPFVICCCAKVKIKHCCMVSLCWSKNTPTPIEHGATAALHPKGQPQQHQIRSNQKESDSNITGIGAAAKVPFGFAQINVHLCNWAPNYLLDTCTCTIDWDQISPTRSRPRRTAACCTATRRCTRKRIWRRFMCQENCK